MAALGIGLVAPGGLVPAGDHAFCVHPGIHPCLSWQRTRVGGHGRGKARPGPVLKLLAFIGADSYSIYLWHEPFREWVFPGLGRFLGGNSDLVYLSVYASGSIVFGIVMGKALEYPVLRFRDKMFPSRIGAAVLETSNESTAGGMLTQGTPV